MKITLTFQSDGDDTRLIRATWLPVGKRAGGDNEVTRTVGVIYHRWVGAVQEADWTVKLNLASGPLIMRRETEDEARRAVSDYFDENGRWWS